MSKTKRRRIIAVSTLALAALGIFYVGPSKIAEKISDTAQGLSDLHEKLAYTTKTKTESKTISEWYGVAGYTDQKEMERLAALPLVSDLCPDTAPDDCKNIIAASCAAILNTCHLAEDDLKAHKKAYLQKSFKFHPDKHPNEKELADQAQKALNHVKDLMNYEIRENGNFVIDEYNNKVKKKKETCEGAKGSSSEESKHEICAKETGTWTLREPNWLYKKLGVESECQILFEGGDPTALSPAECSHMI